jgi:hypothetical protein
MEAMIERATTYQNDKLRDYHQTLVSAAVAGKLAEQKELDA